MESSNKTSLFSVSSEHNIQQLLLWEIFQIFLSVANEIIRVAELVIVTVRFLQADPEKFSVCLAFSFGFNFHADGF